ncbi:MAG TPA: hypothetical protein VKI41_16630, partial [Vicinamibacteria bacterium]|nr:hypothetical protein [Vicinamibacteria bacterium]
MKTLVFWGGGSADRARRQHREGAVFVLWGEKRRALDAASIPFRTADFPPAQAEGVERAALRWSRAWPRIPLVDGRSFRELVEWKGLSLADLLEDFWRASPRLGDYVRVIETVELLLEQETPDEVEAVGLTGPTALLLGRACTRRGILYHGPQPRPSQAGSGAAFRGRVQALAMVARALRARLSGDPPPPACGGRAVALLFLSAEEGLASLARAAGADPLLCSFAVTVGARTPRPSLEDYPALREVRAVSRRLREIWDRLRRSPALGDAFSHRGLAFADLARRDLAELMLVWLPRAVSRFEQAAAVLRAIRPAVVCLGRAPGPLLLACRAAGVPTVEPQAGETGE